MAVNKWYICEMKTVILSADGPYYVVRVPDNIANDLAGFVSLFYHVRPWEKKEVVFVGVEELIDFMNSKVPEHPAEVMGIFDEWEDIPQQYRKCSNYNM